MAKKGGGHKDGDSSIERDLRYVLIIELTLLAEKLDLLGRFLA